jgi:hypothetical protein
MLHSVFGMRAGTIVMRALTFSFSYPDTMSQTALRMAVHRGAEFDFL